MFILRCAKDVHDHQQRELGGELGDQVDHLPRTTGETRQ
jgi:hypothetical protein